MPLLSSPPSASLLGSPVSAEAPPTARKLPSCTALLFGVVAVVAVLMVLGVWRVQAERDAALELQDQVAHQAFDPVLEQMGLSAKATPTGPAYDIDTTVRVIHEIDMAIAEADSLSSWLHQLAKQDYRTVAPDVLEARMEMMDILMRLYARQTELEDQQELWELSSGLMMLTTLSIVEVEADIDPLSPGGSLSVDRDKAQEMLDEALVNKDIEAGLRRDVRAVEAELLSAMVKYSEVSYRYLDEWDRLATLRDRAYLATHNGDWETAEAAASAAIEMAPGEREAHLLKALAIVQGGGPDHPERASEALDMLAKYVDDHPSRTAPAFLLMGMIERQRGHTDAAKLHLQQSAAYYPKQADALSDMLDPYKRRAFLRKSREGGTILELYRSTMLGAGTFSPDLQMAELRFDQGDFEGGRAKVMDHFARRRSQQQWDFIISDLRFCHEMLGEDYSRIFPETHYLDLQVEPTLFGSKLELSVTNRSDRVLHNATLVLALQFTDMHPADYETFLGGDTQPAVLASDTTTFGTSEIAFNLHGVDKTVDDIVTHRAILVSNEAVAWVDTDAFKIAENKQLRQASKAAAATANPIARRTPKTWQQKFTDELVGDARSKATLRVDEKFLADDVTIQLPKELAMLRPLFRLRGADGELLLAKQNIIVGDAIQLYFADAIELSDGGGQVTLVTSTPYGDIDMTWRIGADGAVVLQNVGASGP
jgi:tetratricopeptide (TPR) repeat protein